MKLFDGFHPVHFEALEAERVLKRDFSNMGKGDTQKIFIFKNGYGASVIQGFASMGLVELAVIWFPNFDRLPRSKNKRIRKKFISKLDGHHLTYDTPVTSDVKRYYDESELVKDLNIISRLKSI